MSSDRPIRVILIYEDRIEEHVMDDTWEHLTWKQKFGRWFDLLFK